MGSRTASYFKQRKKLFEAVGGPEMHDEGRRRRASRMREKKQLLLFAKTTIIMITAILFPFMHIFSVTGRNKKYWRENPLTTQMWEKIPFGTKQAITSQPTSAALLCQNRKSKWKRWSTFFLLFCYFSCFINNTVFVIVLWWFFFSLSLLKSSSDYYCAPYLQWQQCISQRQRRKGLLK